MITFLFWSFIAMIVLKGIVLIVAPIMIAWSEHQLEQLKAEEANHRWQQYWEKEQLKALDRMIKDDDRRNR